MQMYHIVIGKPFRMYYIFPHSLIKGTICEKKTVIEHKMWVLIFSATLSETLTFC